MRNLRVPSSVRGSPERRICTQFAHVFVGGNFGVDVVSLENQGERHGQDEKSDGQNRQKNYD